MDYRTNPTKLRAHLSRFARTVIDPSLKVAMANQQFESIDRVKQFLDQRVSYQLLERIDKSGDTIKISNSGTGVASNPSSNNTGPKKLSKHGIAVNAFSFDDEEEYRQSQSNVFAFERSGKRFCQECHTEHYIREGGKCNTNTVCNLCEKKGHSDGYCWKACQLCKEHPHSKFDSHCEAKAQLSQLLELVASMKLEDVPTFDRLKF